MNTKTMNINARYYLRPVSEHDSFKVDFNVIDRARELQFLDGVIFSNGTEAGCREWVLRNCEEPREHTPGEWRADNKGNVSYAGLEDFLRSRPDAIVINVPAPPFALGQCGAIVLGDKSKVDAALISTAPKLLALLEQYHQSFPSKESGKLICEAKSWTIQE